MSLLNDLLLEARKNEHNGNYDVDYKLFLQAKSIHSSDLKGLHHVIEEGLWRLNPLWMASIEHNNLLLRPCNSDDANFLRQCFDDSDFMNRFNRQTPLFGNLDKALINVHKKPPVHNGFLMWVIHLKDTGPVGLACLSSIDQVNKKAEFSIGFPRKRLNLVTLKSSLMVIHFSFFMMDLNKLYTQIYEDNHQALKNTLHLGFRHEGTLEEHYLLPNHGVITVYLTGLTKKRLLENKNIRRLASRLINQIW